jgi:hypothetical protein
LHGRWPNDCPLTSNDILLILLMQLIVFQAKVENVITFCETCPGRCESIVWSLPKEAVLWKLHFTKTRSFLLTKYVQFQTHCDLFHI